MSKSLVEKFKEKGCDEDHMIRVKSKIRTSPPQYKYECQTCGNVAVSGQLITKDE